MWCSWNFAACVERVQKTREYEACILSLASPDADPNPDMAVWLSSGGNHLWNPGQKTPATPWEAEIDEPDAAPDGDAAVIPSASGCSTGCRQSSWRTSRWCRWSAPTCWPARRKDLANFQPAAHRTLHSVEYRTAILARRQPGAAPVNQPSPEWSNTRLVAECLAGDERAWSALLDRYKNLIYSIPLALRHAPPGRGRYFPGGLPGSVQRTAAVARCRSLAGMADPRHHEQVLSLEAPPAQTGERSGRGPASRI